MKYIFILLVSLFQFTNLYSQKYYDPIDSIIETTRLGENDWVIALEITQGGRIPLVDSLGNNIDNDPNGAYIITKKNDSCTLQRLDNTLSGNTFGYKISKSFTIFDSIICNYTIDSIKKAQNEWILPNIYKDDSLNAYNVQQKGNHSPSFQMCFKTKQAKHYSHFDDIDVFIPQRLESWFHKNLNYAYNASTFTYRAFINFVNFLKKQYKIQLLE